MKRYKSLIISSVFIALSFLIIHISQTQAAATLVGQWEFDGNFTATNDSNYNGNPSGTVTFVTGQKGQAASFDGGTGIGSYDPAIDKVDSVKLTSASEFNGGLSIMGWVKTDAFPGINEDIRGKVFLSHDQSCCGSQFMGFDFGIGSSGELVYWMNDFNDNRIWGKTSSGTIALGGWAHVAVTWDGNPSGGIQLYLNGAPVSTTLNFLNTFAGLNSTGLLPVRIGASFARSDNVIRGFDGSIDHISIWKGALSAEAILSDYNNTKNNGTVYDLATDWSDTNNPNGPWSYNEGYNIPIPGHQANWLAEQPAWARVPHPTKGHVPCWFKGTRGYWVPIGRIGMHGTSGSSSVVSTPAGVTWTSPISGTVRISGGVWLSMPTDRSARWSIQRNRSEITGGYLNPANPYSADNPFNYANGWGGPSILTFHVNVGDIINLEIVKTSTYAHFVGVDLTITVLTSNPPIADAGTDQPAYVGKVVTLDGSGSSDPDGDPITYNWEFTTVPSGSTAILENPTSVNPTFTVDKAGIYVVSLIVNDGTENSAADTVTISTPVLVAQWEFDGNFTAANDSNYNGNPSGTVTFVTGQKGQAASFDGGTGVGSYDASIDKVDSGKLTSASEFNGGLSSMGWIKPDNGFFSFLSHDNSGGGAEYMGFQFILLNDRSLQLFLRSNNDGRLYGTSAPGAVVLGKWTHVAVTWNGNLSGDIQLYVDGLPITTTINFLVNPFLGLNSTGQLPVRIGAAFADSANNMYGFDGSIDHISLWKGPLSADAILADYNNTKNRAPVAKAGSDQPAHVGHMVTLDGSGSYDADGDLLTYAWKFTSKPNGSNATLRNSTSVNPTFTVDKAGEYKVSLTVHDGKVPNDPLSPIVTVSTVNVPPVAVICEINQPPRVGETVNLDGSCSRDLDGDPLTYLWEFVSKPQDSNATPSDPTAVNPTFTVDKAGEYKVSLTVHDGEVSNDPSSPIATVNTINSPPIACIQPPGDDVRLGYVVMLDGSCSRDIDGDLITYLWTFVSKPAGSNAKLSDPTAVSPTFTADKSGSYVVNLVVYDGKEYNASEPVTINTRNVQPVADAGTDKLIIVIGSTVCLDGTQSHDPDGDDIIYQWSFTSTPGIIPVLENADTPTPCFVADVRGDYIVQLTVTDPLGANSTDTMKISFDNIKPVADAGTGGSVVVGDTVTLNGSKSKDENKDSLTYQWTFVSVPASSHCTIQDQAAMITTFVPDVEGTYVVQLIVKDGNLNSDPSSIQIQVITEQTAAIIAVQACQATIVSMDPSVFKNANMQKTMINKLNAVLGNIKTGNYATALGQLQSDILNKTNGCAASDAPDKNDWITGTDCEAQMLFYQSVQNAIVAVQALMQ